MDCSKLDFSYSREMTPDPLRSGRISEEERRESSTRDEEMMEEKRQKEVL